MSVRVEKQGVEEDDAIAAEFRYGLATMQETGLSGVRRFRDGAGRHGAFDG